MAAKYPRKTTKDEFNRFVAECERLLTLFGLQAWQVDYHHGLSGNARWGDIAYVEFKPTSRLARIFFMDNILDEDHAGFYRDNPESAARHECVHILTAKLEYLADNRFVTREQIDDEVENIARVLEKFKLIPETK